jgi:hypothetical protein
LSSNVTKKIPICLRGNQSHLCGEGIKNSKKQKERKQEQKQIFNGILSL